MLSATAHGGAGGSVVDVAHLLEQLKQVYEQIQHDTNMYKAQRDGYERKLEAQIAELAIVQQSLSELERTHLQVKQTYEEEILRLRRQLEGGGGVAAQVSGSAMHVGHTSLDASPLSARPMQLQGIQPINLQQIGLGAVDRAQISQVMSGLGGGLGGVGQQQILNLGGNAQSSLLGQSGQNVGLGALTAANATHLPSPFNLGGNGHLPHPLGNLTQATDGKVFTLGGGMPLGGGRLNNMTSPMSHQEEKSGDAGKGRTSSAHTDDWSSGGSKIRTGVEAWSVVQNPTATTRVKMELMHTLEHDSVVCCVRFSNNDKGAVETQAALEQLNLHDSYVRSVCFSPDSRYLVAGSEDKTIRIWDIAARRLRHTLVGHTKDIYSVDYSSDGRYVVSGSGDKRAKLWNVVDGTCLRTFGDEDGPKDGVTSVGVSPDGRFVAAGSLDRIVRLWDIETGVLREEFKGHTDSVYSVAFSPDSRLLASGSLDKTLKLWDLTSIGSRSGFSKCRHTFPGHKDFVLSTVFSPNSMWVISGSKDRSVRFWDTTQALQATSPHGEERPAIVLQGHLNSVISVAQSPAANLLATGSGDKRARIWKYGPEK